MPAMTKGEPTRVRLTAKEPAASMPELEVTGVTTVPAPRKLAATRPSRSPRSGVPVSSATSGRSPSPSVETIASNLCSDTQRFISVIVSSETASVSTGMKLSERPRAVISAP
ncbi:hypothetical protein ACVMIX_000578 [Rhizobium leguminosarum]